jgi:chaperone BCS1
MNPAPPFCSIVDRSKIVYNSSETPDRAPVNLLETFIPGYGAVHKFILHAFGFDVTYIVFFGAIVLLVIRVLWRYFTSTISFDNDDPLYHAFMRFSAQLSVQSQHLIARTPKRSAWNVKAGEMNTKKILLNGTPTSVHDFSGLGLASPLYMPAGGNYFLQFKDIRFQLRVKETAIRRMPSAEAPSSNKVIITLLCMGRSTKPLEELLDHVREQYRKGDQNEIRIKKPVPESTRRFGRGSDWEAATVQPARLLGTIAFDPEKKRKIISDIHHFLDVKTVKWYNDHCIPYRRGYLFHGPPGTGKTSMVMAIASTFGLDVHIATLSNTKLTDEDFEALMGKLPPRCVVLLDDVDPDRFIEYPDKPNERISLPCLLNAIDGTSSHGLFQAELLTFCKGSWLLKVASS